MEKTKIILDVDTGSDDAVAIMTALLSPELEVLGICTVNGNRCIEMTTENTLRVVEYLGSDVPVFKGCAMPLVSSLQPGRRPHMPFIGQEDPEENVHSDYLDYLPPATGHHQTAEAKCYHLADRHTDGLGRRHYAGAGGPADQPGRGAAH